MGGPGKRASIKVAVVVAVAIAVAIAMAATAERRPVLLCISPDPAMVRPRNYCLMNPFRDRSPERAAEQFLRRLKHGQTAVLPSGDPSSRAHYVENERNWPIQQWRIGRRKDAGARVTLMYWVKRGNGYSDGGYEEEVYITVDRRGGQPRVTQFGAIY